MDVQTFQAIKSSKYKLKELSSGSDDHKLVKNFFDTTKGNKKQRPSPTDFKVYKILENNPLTTLDEKRNNLMLFHGTTIKGVEGILKEGFKSSKKGWFGRGVYMTDCSDKAQDYCFDVNNYCNCYVFVNEVLNSEKLQTKQQVQKRFTNDFNDCYLYTKPEHMFEKHVYDESQLLTEADYKEDCIGRKYRNISHNWKSKLDEYVADETITIPRYLIVLNWNDNLRNDFINKFYL